MSKQRNHMQTLHKEVFEDVNVGAYAALGGPFYVKKILGKSTTSFSQKQVFIIRYQLNALKQQSADQHNLILH